MLDGLVDESYQRTQLSRSDRLDFIMGKLNRRYKKEPAWDEVWQEIETQLYQTVW